MKSNIVCIAALAAVSGSVMAADFQANYTGQSNSVDVGRPYTAGYMNLTYVGAPYGHGIGQFANASFQTFCIDVQTIGVGGNPFSWTVEAIADAPTPGTNYGAAVETRIHEVMLGALSLNWINNDLSNAGATANQIAAIQALIWNSVPAFNPAVLPSGDVLTQYNTLLAAANSFTGSGKTFSGLRAITTDGQDLLYVVPLPPAAFAGLATLAGIAGVSRLRRR
jgi:hypothetical protein